MMRMKKNKQGFAIIETIITVVVLSTSLLYLYGTYSSIINREETRLYYDDTAYIYRTNYIREFLENNTNIENIKSYAFENSYIITIGPEFDGMFNSEQIANNMKATMENIFTNFSVIQMLIMDSDMLSNCNTSGDDAKCEASTSNLNYAINSYIQTLNDTTYNYYLIVEYSEYTVDGRLSRCVPGTDEGCNLYYVSLGI